ncbi:TIR domain-containing protein [bacterium]|nr:TIR domain-containing protein [bacterium]
MSIFFFSYSHVDKSPYLDSFYVELEKAVKQRLDEAVDQIGFCDKRSLAPGDRWRGELGSALSKTRIFLALYSPQFFSSDYCGKEWTFFQSRIKCQFGSNMNKLPPLIIPILWLPFTNTFKVHPSAEGIQYELDGCPDKYFNEGMQSLVMKDDNTRVDVVRILADRVVECCKNFHLNPATDLPDFNKVQNAFKSLAIAESSQISLNSTFGLKHVRFVFLVGTKPELEGKCQHLEAYGDTPLDWRPYSPNDSDRVAAFSQRVVSENGYTSDFLPLSEDLFELLNTSEKQNNLVVIILDLWSMKEIEEIKDFLEQYDKYNFLNCSIMIPWNVQNIDFESKGDKLKEILEKAIFNTMNLKPQTINIQIESFADLSDTIKNAVEKIRGLLVEKAKVYGCVRSDIIIERPEISGPGRG